MSDRNQTSITLPADDITPDKWNEVYDQIDNLCKGLPKVEKMKGEVRIWGYIEDKD